MEIDGWTDRRTDGHGYIDLTRRPDISYINFVVYAFNALHIS